jgi:thymidylate synthase
MKAYLDIVRRILDEGVLKQNRTGVAAITVPGVMFEHDMAMGFPLLTTKLVPFRLVASEMEFFIKGMTDKEWLRSHKNHIWDEWCAPTIVPYRHDEDSRARMKAERDLGPIYGWQWRHFGARYTGYANQPAGQGVDQLRNLVDRLKADPSDRRMVVLAWNPCDILTMALPPCHYAFQVTVIGGRLNLLWSQRSVERPWGCRSTSPATGSSCTCSPEPRGSGKAGSWASSPTRTSTRTMWPACGNCLNGSHTRCRASRPQGRRTSSSGRTPARRS